MTVGGSEVLPGPCTMGSDLWAQLNPQSSHHGKESVSITTEEGEHSTHRGVWLALIPRLESSLPLRTRASAMPPSEASRLQEDARLWSLLVQELRALGRDGLKLGKAWAPWTNDSAFPIPSLSLCLSNEKRGSWCHTA